MIVPVDILDKILYIFRSSLYVFLHYFVTKYTVAYLKVSVFSAKHLKFC